MRVTWLLEIFVKHQRMAALQQTTDMPAVPIAESKMAILPLHETFGTLTANVYVGYHPTHKDQSVMMIAYLDEAIWRRVAAALREAGWSDVNIATIKLAAIA